MPFEFDAAAEDASVIIDRFEDRCFVFGDDFTFNKHKSHAWLLQDVCRENDLRAAIFSTTAVTLISHMSWVKSAQSPVGFFSSVLHVNIDESQTI